MSITNVKPDAPDARRHRSRAIQIPIRRKLLYMSVVVAMLLAAAELLAQSVLYFAYGRGLQPWERLHEYDSDLGWINIPDRFVADRYGPGKHVTQNGQRLRATHDYQPDIPAGKYRIICLGDSFTYGICGDDETYPAQLERLCPSIEAVNMGGAGFGVDQTYLWYKRDGTRFRANLLLCAFIEDDFTRMSRATFMTRNPKPRLRLDDGSLIASNDPVPTWGECSPTGWFEEFPCKTSLFHLVYTGTTRAFARTDVFPVAERIFDELNGLSRKRDQNLVLVYLPSGYAGASDISQNQPSDTVTWLDSYANDRQVAFLNLTGDFKDLSPEQLTAALQGDGHYSAVGNRLVAEILLRELRARFPDVPRE